jgi:hypothetical protein
LALLLGTAGAAIAQEETGSVYVKVTDVEGAALPGVTAELSGVGAPRITVTNTIGEVRFLGLDPGEYRLHVSLEGFGALEYPNVRVQTARSTTLHVELSAPIGELITVTSESPLLDERKLTTGTTVSRIELEKIPTARDPWAILSQTQAVLSDRVNVGGNESGQQAVFRAPAVSDDENDFLVDGVQITDMAAIGSSPTYYDFDQFSEMQYSTGGSEITKASAGVSVNLVTKRGTNEIRGSSRYLLTDSKGYFGGLDQGAPDVSGDLAPDQEPIEPNRINRIQDYGFEAGGPLKRDHLWLWGSWGSQVVKMTAAGGAPDNTDLENVALKFNGVFRDDNSFIASFNNGDKIKLGRDAGRTRPAETSVDQRGPTGVYKAEDTHVFNSNFFLSGTWSKVDGGFGVISQGVKSAGCAGLDCPFEVETLVDPGGIYRNSYYQFNSSRPAEEWKLDGSYFFGSGLASHEFKFGGRERSAEVFTSFLWPGRNIFHLAGENFGFETGPTDVVSAWRGAWAPANEDYTSLWLQDTISRNSWTANLGLRWDRQKGENPPVTLEANPGFPEVLPAIDFPGNDANGLEWDSICPRIGVTYALGEERDTLIRGSYSQFARSLASWIPGLLNPTGFSAMYFTFTDLNDNNMWDGPEEEYDPLFWWGFDPENPTDLSSPNQIADGLDAEVTSELILGAEHSLLPEFVVGAQLTWREVDDILDEARLVRDESGVVRPETLADYRIVGTVEGTLPDGTDVSLPEWNLEAGLTPTGGRLLLNGPRKREYMGAGVNWTKRLANRWMMRGYFNYVLDDNWSVPDGYIYRLAGTSNAGDTGPNPSELKFDCDGCLYAVQSGGSGDKGDVFLQSTWSWNLNGMYQVAPDRPWGFNIAANLFGREGYPLPYYVTQPGTQDGINRNISIVQDTDDFRTDDVFTIDFRVEKEFATAGDTLFTVSLDGFNLLNEAYVLQRTRQMNLSSANFLDETLSPRIYRLGVRLSWK